MQANEYQRAALRTMGMSNLSEQDDPEYRKKLTLCALGLCGESGEFADMAKKYLFHGHALNREEAAKELGDIAWYLAVAAETLGYTLDEILQMNVDKLSRRYPEGFSSERSIYREEAAVQNL